jgi:thioesterase domain-containing protein
LRTNGSAAPPSQAKLNIREANVRALRLYRAQRYAGRLVVLDAKEDPTSSSPVDKRLGWRDLAIEGLERRVLDGSHGTIVTEPFAANTASVLEELIGQATAAVEEPQEGLAQVRG